MKLDLAGHGARACPMLLERARPGALGGGADVAIVLQLAVGAAPWVLARP